MRLIASLTTLTATALLASMLAACAGNAPKKPTSAASKSRDTNLYDNCYDAYSRGFSAPVGCPPYDSGYYRTRRGTGAPGVGMEQPNLPELPTRGAVGGVLGR